MYIYIASRVLCICGKRYTENWILRINTSDRDGVCVCVQQFEKIEHDAIPGKLARCR